MMRLNAAALFVVSAVSLALTAAAQPAPSPPKREPLPEPPPPPPEIANDAELTPEVTTVEHENETIEEYRVHGRLTMVKVTPRHGHTYYLIADASNGGFIRRDSLDTGLRVPLWVLFSF